MFTLTLGPNHGLLVWNDFVTSGKTAAKMKALIERLYMGVEENSKLSKIALNTIFF